MDIKRKSISVSLVLAAALIAGGCGQDKAPATTGKDKAPVTAAAPAANTCCQCPGVWDNTQSPPVYKLPPACANSSASDAVCESDCKSKGHPTGARHAGTCQPAKSGNGETCQ